MKKKPNYFFMILGILFLIFMSYNIAYESGYYESNVSRKSKITQEKLKEFEQDVKENKEVDIKDYVDNDYIDYSSSMSNLGNTISSSINNFIEGGLGNVFDFFGKLFI